MVLNPTPWTVLPLFFQLLRQNTPVQDLETGIIRTPGRHFWYGILSTIFLESFTLTFLAEWGDRSQISTIILGAREVHQTVFGWMCVYVHIFEGRGRGLNYKLDGTDITYLAEQLVLFSLRVSRTYAFLVNMVFYVSLCACLAQFFTHTHTCTHTCMHTFQSRSHAQSHKISSQIKPLVCRKKVILQLVRTLQSVHGYDLLHVIIGT